MWHYQGTDNDGLYHYGVLGMKWGVRKNRSAIPRKTRREAAKDAKEFARAKMFYGEGAGTRRKLINAKVKQKSKDPLYKEEFERRLASQDMAKHSVKAREERKVKDFKNTTAKTARGIVNVATGNVARASAAVIAGYGAYRIGKKTGVNDIIAKKAKETVSSAAAYVKKANVKGKVNNIIRKMSKGNG